MSASIEQTPLGLASMAIRDAEHDVEAVLDIPSIPDFDDLFIRRDGASLGGELVIDFGHETCAPTAKELAGLLAEVVAKHGIGTVTVFREIVDSFEVPEAT